jgi:hypothetical protein
MFKKSKIQCFVNNLILLSFISILKQFRLGLVFHLGRAGPLLRLVIVNLPLARPNLFLKPGSGKPVLSFTSGLVILF